MEGLPLDPSHPAVRDYLHLIRLQVLTPLSLVINMATVLVCTVIATPGIGDISSLHPTPITPAKMPIAVYAILIYVFQIGYCLLLVLARKPETKKTFLKGVGISLVFANWVVAFWAIAWVLQQFLLSTIFLGVLLALLIYANIVLAIYHLPATWKERPLDLVLIHAPLKLFLILILNIGIEVSIFIMLHLTYPPSQPNEAMKYPLPSLLVILCTNLLSLIVIVWRQDFVWCVGAVWVDVSIWIGKWRGVTVWIPALAFTVIHPLALVLTVIYLRLRKPRQPIALPPDDEEQAAVQGRPQRPAGEVTAEDIWG
ncbi:hypothetical protein NEOLEDRAFT_1109013 [Neolentinus lepideus HHB14362 ss-1]|uniref:Uncharacterized protein n=1 Tax=Neolentinus lepideus HHB14362 ss-1 TaxID=1314782 RepID=A0A165UID6_9AGAM|nr:hypothetical protein NEOLEDRAFT_1109013 [Neolentinus lepideus HHB14362 ss-1]